MIKGNGVNVLGRLALRSPIFVPLTRFTSSAMEYYNIRYEQTNKTGKMKPLLYALINDRKTKKSFIVKMKMFLSKQNF